MDKSKILDEIFKNDPLFLLDVKPKISGVLSDKERLISNFQEICDFYKKKGEIPTENINDISEFQLGSRLNKIIKDDNKLLILKEFDIYNLLPEINYMNESECEYNISNKTKQYNSLDDIIDDDPLNLLGDEDISIFEMKHVSSEVERAKADFVARRKPCKNFGNYEAMFKKIQQDLVEGKRSLVDFKEDNLFEGEYYVHNGILMLLEKINISQTEQSFSSGHRIRKDGRTRCVFENGTVSNMLYRSLAKILYVNGKVVTRNKDEILTGFISDFNNITVEDETTGYIYVLKSESKDEKISKIDNLYKIGFSNVDVERRIKNADKEPTYLMAPVKIIGIWKCYNMNPHKFEQLLHQFFGRSCLEIDIFDEIGKRHSPREWFIVPIEVIEQVVELIIDRKIVNYKYDVNKQIIIHK